MDYCWFLRIESCVCGMGVKQSDPMSPFLFNLVLYTCLRKLEGGVRLTDGLRLNQIAFTNNVVLIASQMDELQSIFNCYTGALEQIGLEIHPGKCQSLEVLVRNSLRLSGGGGNKTVHGSYWVQKCLIHS